MWFQRRKAEMPIPETALPDRAEPIRPSNAHFVTETSMLPPFPDQAELAYFGMGCFWGAERIFWGLPGVITTAVGYAGGHTANATYDDVCSGQTGHTEAVLVVFDPERVTYERLLQEFWESHDPTQGMRQGNDTGTQYRSAIYWTTPEQELLAQETRQRYTENLSGAGYGPITTEIAEAGPFYYAEEYHQQYLAKNPNGYCGIEGTGVSCPVGIGTIGDSDAGPQ
jgi:peptide-methionine (S)-S-oxide reductase